MSIIGQIQFDWTKLFLGPIAGATVTAFVTLIIWWFNRKRPSIIECRELESFSLLRISPSVRKRIDVQFDGDKIAALSQSEIEVVNRGAETVDNVNIRFEFPKTTRVLEVVVSPNGCEIERDSDVSIKVSIPYLNAFWPHRERVIVSVICEGSTRKLSISGRGHGWSIKHSSFLSTWRRRMAIVVLSLFASLFWLIGYSLWVSSSLGIPFNEISFRAILAYLPGFIPTIAAYITGTFSLFSLLKPIWRMLDTDRGEKSDTPMSSARRNSRS